MKFTKEIARWVRKLEGSEELLIQKVDNGYWITDKFMAVHFTEGEFKEFKYKFENYKNTPEIPEICKFNTVISTSPNKTDLTPFREASTDIRTILGNDQENKGLTPTNFYFEEGRICLIEEMEEILLFHKQYEFIYNQFEKHKTEGSYKPVKCYQDNQLKALIMPIRPEKLEDEDFEDLEEVKTYLTN